MSYYNEKKTVQTESDAVSQFNAAIDNLSKLSIWQYAAEICKSRGDFYNMKLNLDNVWLRVEIYIQEMEVEWQERFYELKKRLDYNIRTYRFISMMIEQKKQINDKISLQQINDMLEEDCVTYLIMLRKVIHKKKMDMPEKRTFNPEDALDEGAED